MIHCRKKPEQPAKATSEYMEAIVDAIKDPILLLSEDLKVYLANHAFYRFFKSSRNATVGKLVYDLGNGQWNISTLKKLLNDILPKKTQITGFEVTHDFENIGLKTLLLNAKKLQLKKSKTKAIIIAIEDITAHATSEGMLSSFETRYRKLFESAIDGSVIIDAKTGTIIDANQLFVDLLGFSHKQFLAKKIWDIGLFKDIASNKTQFCKMQEEDAVKDRKITLKTAKGQLIDVEFISKVFTVDNQKIIQCLIRNLTERKKAEDLLAKNEAHLRAILESTDDGILAVDYNGKILHTNHRFAQLWHLPDKLIYKGDDNALLAYVLDQLVDPKAFLAKVKQLYKVTRTAFDTVMFKDGRVFERFSTPLILKKQNLGRVWSFRDVTKKVKAEATVLEAKAKNEAILSSIGDAVFACDKEGTILLFNAMAEEMTGVSAKQAIGRHYSQTVNFIKESDGKPCTSFIIEAIKRNKTTEMTNHVLLVSRDGGKIPVADSAAPIKNANNETIGCVVVFHDVTKERQIDKAKTEFVSLASHQLRTPLSTINWYSEMLLSEDVGKLTPRQCKYSQEVYKSSQRMVNLVNSLLNVSRLEMGTFAVEPELVDIVKIAKNSLTEYKSQIAERRLTIRQKYDVSGLSFKADPKLLSIIFNNLLSNSITYTENGGRISLTVSKKKNDLLIRVADTGIGIPKDQQKEIFEKLFRADNAKKIDPNGSGLGLYIIKEIISHTGGKVWFESDEGKGTVFYISFPLSGMKEIKGAKQLI